MADIYQEAAESIVSADRAAAEEVAQRALDSGIAPADIMQNGFVKGIQEVGDLFESGEVFLPELMMSADAMAGATEVTNAALEGEAAEAKGVIVHRHRPGRRARHRQGDRDRLPEGQRLRGHRPRPRRLRRQLHRRAPRSSPPTSSA